MVVLFAAGHGLAWGTRGPLMQAIRADYFGRKAFATIMGYSFLIAMLGTMGGPLIAGAFADAFGNYRVGFTILAGMAACGSVFFLLAREP
jgi:MFS family permease